MTEEEIENIRANEERIIQEGEALLATIKENAELDKEHWIGHSGSIWLSEYVSLLKRQNKIAYRRGLMDKEKELLGSEANAWALFLEEDMDLRLCATYESAQAEKRVKFTPEWEIVPVKILKMEEK